MTTFLVIETSIKVAIIVVAALFLYSTMNGGNHGGHT